MPLPSGTRLGSFEVITLIGAGGMGEVYRARDTRLDRIVALKVLAGTVDDTAARRLERFRREAKVVARISHPNICALHDIGEDDGVTFLVMEYIDGATLASRLEDGPIAIPAALRIAIQIADALDHAHQQGVVHRDLKPANVMLTSDAVKLLDFGLAKLRERDEDLPTLPTESRSLTAMHTVLGTVPYMAPEQVEGHDVDARTDIFAFGVVLHEMIAGRRPFAGDSRASLMAAIVGSDAPPLASQAPLTPPALERLVLRCLAKAPKDRWQTVRDLAAELRWIGDTDPAKSMRQPLRVRRRVPAMLLGGLAGAAATAVLAGLAWPLLQSRPTLPSYSPITTRHGAVSSARFAPDDQSIVYSAGWAVEPYELFLGREGTSDARALGLRDGRILSVSRTGDLAVLFGRQTIAQTFRERTLARVPLAGGARRDLLDNVIDADWVPGTEDLAVVVDPPGPGPWSVEFPAGRKVHEAPAAWSIRTSPDGRHIAFIEGPAFFTSIPEGQVSVVDRSGQRRVLTEGWSALGLAWAPGGDEIWFTGTRAVGYTPPSIHAVTLDGTLREVHRLPDWLVLHDISREGRVLVAKNSIRTTMTCQPPGETTERDLGWLFSSQVSDLSADGRTVIFAEVLEGGTGNFPLFRRQVDASPAVRLGDGRMGRLSPDGQWVLAIVNDGLALIPMGAGVARTLPATGDLARVVNAAWLSNDRIVMDAGEAGERRVHVQDVAGGAPRPVTPAGVGLAANAPTPDGRSVLGIGWADNRWALYPIDGGPARVVSAIRWTDQPIQWASDGRALYAADRSPSVRPVVDIVRVDIETGRRALWKQLAPPDPVGIDAVGRVVMTPDAHAYCYSYMRRLGQLWVADGLK